MVYYYISARGCCDCCESRLKSLEEVINHFTMASLIHFSMWRSSHILRSRVLPLSVVCRLRSLSVTSQSPSTTTTVMIPNIGMKATSESFQKCLTDINFRKAEVQPGCSLHLLSEAEAVVVAEKLSKEFKVQVCLCTEKYKSKILFN